MFFFCFRIIFFVIFIFSVLLLLEITKIAKIIIPIRCIIIVYCFFIIIVRFKFFLFSFFFFPSIDGINKLVLVVHLPGLTYRWNKTLAQNDISKGTEVNFTVIYHGNCFFFLQLCNFKSRARIPGSVERLLFDKNFTMGLGILDPPGHPDSDPILRVPGTHVFWNTDVQTKDTHHIVLTPTVTTLFLTSPYNTSTNVIIISSPPQIPMILSTGLNGRKKW